MNDEELRKRIANLSIWKKNGQRAPHKPLLLLFALAQLQQNQTILSYADTRAKLRKLLFEFGPPRKSYHPEEPFVRLTTDGIWKLNIPVNKHKFSDKQLITDHAAGGFDPAVLALLQGSSRLIQEIAEQLLHDHFPQSVHQDLVDEVGLQLSLATKRRRDPDFRNKILKAYEFSCAICGFNVRLGHNLVAVDAAHIQWHQAGGPDSEENGIALCTLHHKLFDRGVFTITGEREMLVAEEAHGTQGFEEWLMRFHGKRIRAPIHPVYQPKETFIEWHVREVFRGPARYNATYQ
ncbi:phosphorothioated DNA-binding restriction endonuclease [Cohnella faecalis]|uniref:Restriction endonuclease n=1 Tax=Cohnella faecalis TaxID=2315694 RepID=A0A398CCR0_9BACL|nr:HNH endonuclease [Cohnella faecalis]RIE00195.1 restriction endonuclease [Cohnella faecalis]